MEDDVDMLSTYNFFDDNPYQGSPVLESMEEEQLFHID